MKRNEDRVERLINKGELRKTGDYVGRVNNGDKDLVRLCFLGTYTNHHVCCLAIEQDIQKRYKSSGHTSLAVNVAWQNCNLFKIP